jgi:hypothetical protein
MNRPHASEAASADETTKSHPNSGARTKESTRSPASLMIIVPGEPPMITPAAACALLKVLVAAARERGSRQPGP